LIEGTATLSAHYPLARAGGASGNIAPITGILFSTRAAKLSQVIGRELA
jgi:hypothetical protein